MRVNWWIVGGIALVLIAGREVVLSSAVRGIRNNNPGNIRDSAGDTWEGQTGTDGAFAVFSAPEYGIRALGKLLLNYYYKYGLNTVDDIISRYAPDSENNTAAYVGSVANELGVFSWFGMAVDRRLPDLVKAIIKHENGVQPYSDDLIWRGLGMIEGYTG